MTVRYGRYEIVCKLGEGAMAAVHLGRDPVLTRFVAVKVLHPGVAAGKVALQRFYNEARTVARIRSPHVVDVFDFGREGKEFFLVMEFVDGQSLQGVLKQLGSAGLPDVLTASLICQAAEGLDMAARHGVVHRDIKPENLMINSQGYLKIADFGIAHLQDESLTRTGAVLGSPLYMSPEQVRGSKPITSQSDMFSLGAVIYRCLVGAPPFESRNLKDLYRKIAAEAHVPLLRARPDLDPALARLVETLLRKDPAARGEGPRWLRAQLRSWLLARGVDDAPDLVAGQLRELSERGIRTTWQLEQPGPIPRTVAATAPVTLPADRSAPRDATAKSAPWAAPWADPGPAAFGASGPIPNKVGRRPRPGIAVLAALPAIMVVGVLAFFAWLGPERPTSPESGAAGMGADSSGLSFGPSDHALASPGWKASPDPASGGTVSRSGETRKDPVPVAAGVDEETRYLEPEAALDTLPMRMNDAAAAKATLIIHSSPPFAEIYLDGRSLGVAPVTVPDLPVGPHRLIAKGRLGQPVDTLLRVEPGRSLVRIRLDAGRIALDSEEEERE